MGRLGREGKEKRTSITKFVAWIVRLTTCADVPRGTIEFCINRCRSGDNYSENYELHIAVLSGSMTSAACILSQHVTEVKIKEQDER